MMEVESFLDLISLEILDDKSYLMMDQDTKFYYR